MKSSPTKLAMFLQASEAPTVTWREDEFGAILEHQLEVPLATIRPGFSSELTMRRVFEGEAPIECIIECKEWAKRNLYLQEPPIPHPVCMVLYYAAICKGRLDHRKQITTLDDRAVADGIEWCLKKKWLPTLLTDLFQKTKASLPTAS